MDPSESTKAPQTQDSQEPALTTGKINCLQVYRGIAAILVVFFHVTSLSPEKYGFVFLNNFFLFGYTGVDFFFVLSGFIIFYMHAKDCGNRARMKPYMVKRLVRIYPIYWFITFAKLTALIAIPSLAKAYETQIQVIIASFLLLPQNNLPVIGAAWTLSYEMLFYLLFGVAIGLGRRWSLRLFGLWTLAVLVYSCGKAAGAPHLPNHYLAGFFFNERNLEFILGCLSAYAVLKYRMKYPLLMAITGIALYLAAGLYVSQGGRVPSHTLLFGLPSLLLVTGSASLELRRMVKFPRLLVYLGDASYSIYLAHAMCINILMIFFSRIPRLFQASPALSLFAISIGAVVGGCAMYHFIEHPMLAFLKSRISSRAQSKPSISYSMPLSEGK